jgi:poly(3-hydroxyalkanoate) synthetase
MIVVPPLINKSYIMHHGEQSMTSSLTAQGVGVFMLQWQNVTGAESATWGLQAYVDMVNETIALIQASIPSHIPLGVIGYCMGGILAAMAVCKKEAPHAAKASAVDSLVCIATPWDFSRTTFGRVASPNLEQIFANQEIITPELWQAYFYLRTFYDSNTSYATPSQSYITIEQWIADGVNMSKKFFLEFNQYIVYENQLHNGILNIYGKIYDLTKLAIPSLIVIGQKDHLIPPESCLNALCSLPNSNAVSLPTGHTGLVLSQGHNTAEQIIKWLERLELSSYRYTQISAS